MVAGVDLGGPEDAVVRQLLNPMGQPAGHPRNGKDGGELVNRDTELVVDHPRVEIDV